MPGRDSNSTSLSSGGCRPGECKHCIPDASSDIMRHIARQFDLKFHETRINASPVPGNLNDHFPGTFLFNRIDIGLLISHQYFKPGPCRFGMAIQNIASDQSISALPPENRDSPVIHLDNRTPGVTDHNGTGKFSNPLVLSHSKSPCEQSASRQAVEKRTGFLPPGEIPRPSLNDLLCRNVSGTTCL